MKKQLSSALAAALAWGTLPAPARSQAAAITSAHVFAVPAGGGVGRAGLALGGLSQSVLDTALGAGGLRVGLGPITPLVGNSARPSVALPQAATSLAAFAAPAARPAPTAAAHAFGPLAAAAAPAAPAPTQEPGKTPAAKTAAQELSSRLREIPELGTERAELLDRFFSGSGPAHEDADPAVVSSLQAWLPTGEAAGPLFGPRTVPAPGQALSLLHPGFGADGLRGASDARALAAFVLSDQASLSLLARESAVPAPGAADALVAAFESGTGRGLSPERRRALRELLSAQGRDGETPVSRLARQAERVLSVQELMSVLAQTRRLYARFFPEFDRALPVRLSFEANLRSGGSFKLPGDGTREIKLEGPSLPVPGREEPRIHTPFDSAPPLDSRLMRLVIAFHEYAHALFYERTGAKPDRTNGYTAFDAVNEGFAVTLELLMIDKALAAREELGLSAADAQDLRAWKSGRLSMLRGRSHYTEGTLRFWHGIYREGGEAAVLSTLDGLVPERLQGVPVGHPVFALAGGEPRLAEAFTRDSPLWEVWRALANHAAAGSPLTGALREAAAAALGLVRPAALDRFFELTLNTRRPNVLSEALMSPSALSTLLRLALLSPALAGRLAGFLHERLPRVRPSLILARGPAWMEALVQALAILPLSDGQRADLRRTVQAWASDPIQGLKQERARQAAWARYSLF